MSPWTVWATFVQELPCPPPGHYRERTRKFLNDVAQTVQALTDQRDQLQRSLDETNEQQPRVAPENPTAIGNVLLAAQRAGEELVAHARATADQITAAAQEETERLLEEARRSAAAAEQSSRKVERRMSWTTLVFGASSRSRVRSSKRNVKA